MSVVVATRTIPPMGTPGEWTMTPYGWQWTPATKPGVPAWAIAALVVVVLLFAGGVYFALSATNAETDRNQQTEQRYDQYRQCIDNPSGQKLPVAARALCPVLRDAMVNLAVIIGVNQCRTSHWLDHRPGRSEPNAEPPMTPTSSHRRPNHHRGGSIASRRSTALHVR